MTVKTSGFVFRGGDAYAIYHAVLHRHGEQPKADLAIGIGTWRADDSVADASAFMSVWSVPKDINFGFVDAADSVWANAHLLKNQLTAADARSSEFRADFIRVAELVVRNDPSVDHHLSHGA